MFRHTSRLWAGNLPLRALTGAALGVGLSCCRTAAAETRQEAARPNILLIVCDQLSARATALYSPGFAATPNLDRLLEESQRFTRAYTVCPLCMPARAAMWSGRYPHETDVVSNLEPPRQAAHPTLGEVFSRAGYRTVHFGKQHDAGMLRGFERNELGPMREFRSELPVNYDSFYDVDTTGKMVEYLKNDPGGGRPFLAVADLHNPHNICQFIGENDRLPLPEPEKLPPLPANFRCGDFGSRPLPVRYICCTHPRQRQAAHWTPERYRFYLYAYAQYISMADRQIGEILQALKESGKENDTIVVFTADHGEGMAAFGLVTKHVALYENAVNIPLAIRDPAHPERKGTDRERLVSNLDLFPTLCALAGIEPPPGLPGVPLTAAKGRDHVVSEWVSEYFNAVSPGRMLADRRFKYIHYREGDGEELYDLKNDPGETRNLAPLPEFGRTLAHYRALLREHVAATDDAYFELPVIVDRKYRSHAAGFANHTGPDAITEGRETAPERGRRNLETYLKAAAAARKGEK